MHEISWDEVVRAGTVIFGPSFVLAAHQGGWHGELKRAFRLRAFETHPDRAAVLGRTEEELAREFRAVSEAFELLIQLRAGPLPSLRPPPPVNPPPTPRQARPAPHVARPHRPSAAPFRPSRPAPAPGPTRPAGAERAEPKAAAAGRATSARAPASTPGAATQVPPWAAVGLPKRRLRMAEFLYYSGRVGWQDFVDAVAWQRGQRPAVGRIAVDFGFLERFEVIEILEKRRTEGARDPFGEFAVRRGYLTPFQLLAMLGQQLRLQQPIGRFFVSRGLVSDADLDHARSVIFRHNSRHAG